MKIVKSLIGVSAMVISAAPMADEFIVQQQHVNVSQHVVVDAVDERIGDIAVEKFDREEAIRIKAENEAAWAASLQKFVELRVGSPYFPYSYNAETADDIFALVKQAEETPVLSVEKTMNNWDNYSF